ncbi:hypothetical protein FQA39_LY12580 [Lamprigera yunnana]|nr:hypothetical protein FQA39_LY12580 [Lamprigera yunnana]
MVSTRDPVARATVLLVVLSGETPSSRNLHVSLDDVESVSESDDDQNANPVTVQQATPTVPQITRTVQHVIRTVQQVIPTDESDWYTTNGKYLHFAFTAENGIKPEMAVAL